MDHSGRFGNSTLLFLARRSNPNLDIASSTFYHFGSVCPRSPQTLLVTTVCRSRGTAVSSLPWIRTTVYRVASWLSHPAISQTLYDFRQNLWNTRSLPDAMLDDCAVSASHISNIVRGGGVGKRNLAERVVFMFGRPYRGRGMAGVRHDFGQDCSNIPKALGFYSYSYTLTGGSHLSDAMLTSQEQTNIQKNKQTICLKEASISGLDTATNTVALATKTSMAVAKFWLLKIHLQTVNATKCFSQFRTLYIV